MKVGILGGTFDPVHNGHLILAEHARTQLALDSVLFVPAGDPWRKSHRTITPAEYRLAMLMLAITDHAQFAISDIELRHPGPTYTADTLEALAAERLDDEFYFIVGADALADLPTWHDPARIVRHAMIAVAERNGHQLEAAIAAVPELAHRIVRFDMPPTEISSTDIRARAAAGDDIASLVPPAGARYIAEHRLYATP